MSVVSESAVSEVSEAVAVANFVADRVWSGDVSVCAVAEVSEAEAAVTEAAVSEATVP